MTLHRVLLGLLVALLALVPATPAYAKGTSTVVLVNPASEQAYAAYFTNPLYAELERAVGDAQQGPTRQPSSLGVDRIENLRLTWLANDLWVDQVAWIHLTRNDGIWIETASGTGLAHAT